MIELSPVILSLPLVGGYALSVIWDASLYHSARESGHRLYFRAVFYAIFLIVVAALIHVILFVYIDRYVVLLRLTHQVAQNFAGTTMQIAPSSREFMIWSNESKILILIYSFVLGPMLGIFLSKVMNRVLSGILRLVYIFFPDMFKLGIEPPELWNKLLLRSAIKNNEFEQLIAHSFYLHKPLLITLSSGKIYVGWAVRAPNPTDHGQQYLRILPLLSGYRDQQTQVVNFMTDYLFVMNRMNNATTSDFDHLSPRDFEVVIPSSEISSAHFFDLVAYNHFQEGRIKRKEHSSTSRPKWSIRRRAGVNRPLHSSDISLRAH